MDVTVRQGPAFAVARVGLSGGEEVKVEAGAMMGHSGGVELDSKIEGGLMKGLKRSVLGDESLFVTKYVAPGEGGWVDCAARLPGDITVLGVDGAVNLTRGSWLCSSQGVATDARSTHALAGRSVAVAACQETGRRAIVAIATPSVATPAVESA